MTETHHQFAVAGRVIELPKIDGQRFAVIEIPRPEGGIPFHIGVPIERGKFLLGGDDVTITLSWTHGDDATRMIALHTGELDPATEVDSEGNHPVPVGD